MVTSHPLASPLDSIPPHLILRDVLDAPTVAALLEYAYAREADFKPSTLLSQDGEAVVKAGFRQSLQLRDLGKFQPLLRSIVHDRAAELMAQLRMSSAETTPFFETELVAHGDGGFLNRHTDIARRDHGRPDVRVLSGVYYLHRTPKAFSGGELRLFSLAESRFLDVEPTHNSLVLFPSWAPHEVRPVSCPSHRFADARFSVNCWVYARLPAHKGAA